MVQSVKTPSRPEPVALNRRAILEVAIVELDQHGLSNFSMRRLAAALNISAPSLYWHFRSRDDLLRELVDHAFAGINTAPSPASPWNDEVLHVLSQAWQVGRRHPGLLPLLPTAPAYPTSAQRMVQRVLLILRRAGFAPYDAVRCTRSLIWTTFGLMRAADPGLLGHDATSSHSVPARLYLDLDGLVGDDLTLLSECLPALSEINVDELFDRTLRLLLASMTPSGTPQTARQPNERRR